MWIFLFNEYSLENPLIHSSPDSQEPIKRSLIKNHEFHLKFIKETLGVHCKASNVGCRAKLNRRPIHIKIIYSIFNFLHHILTSENTLVLDIQCPGKTLIFGTHGFQHFAIANIDHLFFV
jgi:hypothetical protein